jgi:hypothetical protein
LATQDEQFEASRHVAHGDTQGWHTLLESGYFPETHVAAHVLAIGSCSINIFGAGIHD